MANQFDRFEYTAMVLKKCHFKMHHLVNSSTTYTFMVKLGSSNCCGLKDAPVVRLHLSLINQAAKHVKVKYCSP